jgi:hypothetical protein
MKHRFSPWLLIAFLALLSASALGIAVSNTALLRVHSFEVTSDCDSLRSDFLTVLLESIHTDNVLKLRVSDIYDVFSDLPHADNIVVEKSLIGSIRIDLIAKKPVLKVSNHTDSVCLNSEGIPFRWQPEHGDLPQFTVSSDISVEQLINPGDHILEFYNLALFWLQYPFPNLSNFSHLSDADEFQLLLSDPTTNHQLRIARQYREVPSYSYTRLENWLANKPSPDEATEFDLRFPGILVIRRIEEASEHV